MSITSHLSDNPDKIFKKSFHRRNNSGELDVFEAARYFSGCNEVSYTGGGGYQKIFREDHGGRRGAGRMSLDLPIRTNVVPLPPPPYTAEKQTIKEKKHRQQPSSPGGRLANFLNSLFNQSASKKKKKPKNPIKSEDQEIGSAGRKRRSSLSNLIDSKSSSNFSVSGFRTPPTPNCTLQTPNKNYKEIRTLLSSSNNNLGNGSFNQVAYNNNYKQNSDRHQENEIRKINGLDEGADSDSSSDLFELRIGDFDCYSSSGLPVYETTNIHTIKRSTAQIS
ncbi:protein BIG GRAIN 1-like E [Momordica charantia]|uniref:Protein BIG GRAIN 1-like E n=1 Tax=Momordica charantia TaxID=3673 RepID=A0A6J1D6V3_MOMCH|nr:protein BIG GRAIN 1-like E [Momordica charantia]